jgi:Spy/CpxP family protein refolding chaperone
MALAFVGAGGVSYAQWVAEGDKSDKAHERLEIITMWKMMEALDLDKATADKILEIRHKFLAQRKALKARVTKDIMALKQRLAQTTAPDDPELAQLVADIRANRKKLMQLREEQYEEVSKVLTVRQQAELVIFLKEFRKELRHLLPLAQGDSDRDDSAPGYRPGLRSHQPPRGIERPEGLRQEK